jgi:Domain of unknown function (DUF4234)
MTGPDSTQPSPSPVPPPPEAAQPYETGPYGYAPPPPGYGQEPSGQQPYPQPGYGGQPMPGVPGYAQYARPQGPIGRIRPTGMIMLLFFVTLGIWSFVYYFQTHEEMKRHTGEGLGGVLALVIAIVFGLLNPFLLSNEVGQLYERRGQEKPVSALTALWFFPGIFILVGPFVWFIQTNNALNDYWQSLGARETTLV